MKMKCKYNILGRVKNYTEEDDLEGYGTTKTEN